MLPGAHPLNVRGYIGAALALIAIALIAWITLPKQSGLTIYCAHDSIYSESILKDFEAETGIHVDIKFDTEATKSLGLVELILREAENPRCDVFWNNEVCGTFDLQRRGLLVPYKGTGYARIPAAYKDPEGLWTGFAARLRVWIVNTKRHEANIEAINATLAGSDLHEMTMAKPLFGTTRTHYTVLWHLWGPDKLKQWHRDMLARHRVEAGSNGQTMRLVSEGKCSLGWTDTDDFFDARDSGAPVAMVPAQVEDGQTICIPNTVSIIKGTRHAEEARKLVDYLLSEKVELKLARSKSRQIPLGPVDASQLPPEVAELLPAAAKGYDLTALGDAPAKCLDWLKSEYLH